MSDADEKLMAHGQQKIEAPTGLTVQVTPKMVVGSEVICEIDPAPGTPHRYVKGGLIKLPGGGNYAITFQLMAGDVANLQFDATDPFWSAGTCPTMAGNDGQLSPQTPCSANSLDVDATPGSAKNALYYRLNFTQNGTPLYCDPIIINN
jgi:hypothetical protein